MERGGLEGRWSNCERAEGHRPSVDLVLLKIKYTVSQLALSGVCVRSHGPRHRQSLRAGYSAADLREGGYSMNEIREWPELSVRLLHQRDEGWWLHAERT